MKKTEDHYEEVEEQQIEEIIPEELPILPVRKSVLFPGIAMPIIVSAPRARALVESADGEEMFVGVVTQKSEDIEEPNPDDLYPVGVAAHLLKTVTSPDGTLYAVVQGVQRVRLIEYLQDQPYYTAKTEMLTDVVEEDNEMLAIVQHVKDTVHAMSKLSEQIPEELVTLLLNVKEAGILADILSENPNLPLQDRQELLEETNVKARLKRIVRFLAEEKGKLELSKHIQTQVQDEIDKNQREYYLREQLRAIQKELGEPEDEELDETEELRKRIEEKAMPEEAKKVANKEVDRLSKMHPAAAEYTVSRTYVDWILDLPWEEGTQDTLDIHKAEEVLEEDHYGLSKVKKRILEYLAVRQLTETPKEPILCFVGPPGVGKTSLGRSVARALNRKFVRMSLGGIRDEAEIRGHRRTYIGALPGRIIQGMKKAESHNPVFMLDEIDKVGGYFRGDPASALLEVLDPEQNDSFADNYLELPFDLSQVMFITTANDLSTIPAPLLDRMEVIQIAGYTEEEKVMISKQYLIPRQLKAHGLTAEQLRIDESALTALIHSYTREAGVRNLEREIASLCRGVARKVVEGQTEPVTIKNTDVAEYLGPVKFFPQVAERTAQPGVATGLAWTPVGGDILFVESTRMKGHEKLILTGKLGEVMKESAEIALSYVRSKAGMFGIPENFRQDTDIHVHVPSGSISKDGPSAGVTLYTSLVSLFTDKPVRSDTAMTGEVTLRGLVLPVGGIKEKVLAARSAGVKHIILPAKNEKDLDEIPEHLRKDMTFHFVEKMDDVINFALGAGEEQTA